MIEKIQIGLSMIGELNPWICLMLFLVYGVAFEMLSVKFLVFFREHKKMPASIISVTLYLINIWGLSESLNDNIFYCIPVALGTFVGTYFQMAMDKKGRDKGEKEREAGN